MTSATKLTTLLSILLLAVLAVIGQFIRVDEPKFELTQHTANVGELTPDVLVGQTFTAQDPNLSGVSVMFATYVGRTITAPVEFHLRESINSSQDIRVSSVDPSDLGDNRLHTFTFEPIPDSANKQYFFFVVSPQATGGRAVTVDVNTQDPYHLGTAYIAKSPGSNVTDPALLARSGKQTLDVVFGIYHSVPLNRYVAHQVRAAGYHFITTWDERRYQYLLWGQQLLPAVLFLVLLFYLHNKNDATALVTRRSRALALISICAAGLFFRYLYAKELPITFDEGNYLYDARILREGALAGGDGYVKAPLVIAWVAFWQFIMGDTLMAGRLASMIASTALVLPIYSIGHHVKNRITGILAAAAWALFGAAIVSGIYVHTQAVALLFGVSGVALLWSALRGTTPRFSFRASLPITSVSLFWFFLAGVLLGLGVASRKSILAIGLVPLLLIMVEGSSWRLRFKYLLSVGSGFLLILMIFLGGSYVVYGPEGVLEAIGLNSAEDGVTSVEESAREQVRAYSLRGMTPFFRESLPFILLSMLGWGFLGESAIRNFIREKLTRRPSRFVLGLLQYAVPKIGWILPVLTFWWALSFFFEYEGQAFHIFGLESLWYVMAAAIGLAAVLPPSPDEKFQFKEQAASLTSTQPNLNPVINTAPGLAQVVKDGTPTRLIKLPLQTTAALLLPAWVGGLTIFYMNWIKFHANYIGEFLPPLTVLSGVGALLLWQRLKQVVPFEQDYPFVAVGRRLVLVGVLTTFLWALFISNYITYLHEHTGTFTQQAAREAAIWAQQNIPKDQTIFTGAALIPYLSGHRVALDIAHPRWYAYEFTRKNPKRLNTFLPPIEEMLQAYRNTTWLLLESQTGFSFLMEYTEIGAGIERDFIRMHGIENGGNTMTFYKRR